MKRTIYLIYHPNDPGERTQERTFNDSLLFTYDKKPDCPYLEVEMKVVYNQPKYAHQRSKFADKIESTIIIPKDFSK